MTIGSGNQIDAADLNTLYDDARDDFNNLTCVKGDTNKHRKCYVYAMDFESVNSTSYGGVTHSECFTPVADTRLYAIALQSVDAGTDVVSATIQAVSLSGGDGSNLTVTVLDETEYRYMGGHTHEVSHTQSAGSATVTYSAFLTRDGTNGDASELVLMGGIGYRVSVKVDANSTDFVRVALLLETNGQRVAL